MMREMATAPSDMFCLMVGRSRGKNCCPRKGEASRDVERGATTPTWWGRTNTSSDAPDTVSARDGLATTFSGSGTPGRYLCTTTVTPQ